MNSHGFLCSQGLWKRDFHSQTTKSRGRVILLGSHVPKYKQPRKQGIISDSDIRTSDFGRFPKIFWYGRKIWGAGQRKRVQGKEGVILYNIILYTIYNIYIIYSIGFRPWKIKNHQNVRSPKSECPNRPVHELFAK